jgi:hypothetical protein
MSNNRWNGLKKKLVIVLDGTNMDTQFLEMDGLYLSRYSAWKKFCLCNVQIHEREWGCSSNGGDVAQVKDYIYLM